jgi:hypothetical protein
MCLCMVDSSCAWSAIAWSPVPVIGHVPLHGVQRWREQGLASSCAWSCASTWSPVPVLGHVPLHGVQRWCEQGLALGW